MNEDELNSRIEELSSELYDFYLEMLTKHTFEDGSFYINLLMESLKQKMDGTNKGENLN